MKLMLKAVIILMVVAAHVQAQSISYRLSSDVPYYTESELSSDAYKKERGVLDIYYPENSKGFATLVWFHGGGLTDGDKFIPEGLLEKGIAVVAPNYRKHPQVKAPVYIEDAASAVAWVFKNIENYGGDPSAIFVSGHSAGGYLASMVGLDKKWLNAHKIDANDIAGLIPLSGHTITHFTIRKEMGLSHLQPLVNEYAPLYHVRDDAPPLLLITGDREMELWGRYEENAFMMRMMCVAGHADTRVMELDGYDHGMIEPAIPLVLKEMNRVLKMRSE